MTKRLKGSCSTTELQAHASFAFNVERSLILISAYHTEAILKIINVLTLFSLLAAGVFTKSFMKHFFLFRGSFDIIVIS